MQSKLFLTALLFSAVSSVAQAKDLEGASSTAPPRFRKQQWSQAFEKASSYAESHSTESEFVAVNEYIASASAGLRLEFFEENVDYVKQLRTTKSVQLPAYVTALPSSLQGYMSSILEGVANVIETANITASEAKASATGESIHTTVKTNSTATDTGIFATSNGSQQGATNTTSGMQSSANSSVSGSSITAAPTLSASLTSQSSSQNTTSTTATSTSSSIDNAAIQPTGALRVVGALAVGVIGLVAMA